VALTNFPRSPLGRSAELVLTTAARETTFRSGAMSSRLAQLTVIDCVFVGVAQRTYPETRRALDVTYRAVRGRRTGTAGRRG
jgi:DNA-binding MurR/RpiR family transcriptional regulator